MSRSAWLVVLGVALAVFGLTPSLAQTGKFEEAVLLVAHPQFRDADYRQTVLIATSAPNGGHIGVILNRPTRRTLGSLFPEHEPSKRVVDPVYYGGPFSRDALVALVKSEDTLGMGTLELMKGLQLVFRAPTIDRVIETTPNNARYYMGYVGWRPAELRSEIDRGMWAVLLPSVDTVFRGNTEGMWEELLERTRGVRTEMKIPVRLGAVHE